MSYVQLSEKGREAFIANRGWFLAWGILLILLGALAISFSTVTTYVTVFMLGMVLTLFGIIAIIDTFQFWWHIWGGFFIHLFMSILYLATGIMLIKGPLEGSISLTLLLGVLFVAVGGFRMIYSLILQLPGRWWRFFNGFVTLILGILILKSWPMSGLFIIGLFIGIDLLMAGWVSVMASFSARAMAKGMK